METSEERSSKDDYADFLAVDELRDTWYMYTLDFPFYAGWKFLVVCIITERLHKRRNWHLHVPLFIPCLFANVCMINFTCPFDVRSICDETVVFSHSFLSLLLTIKQGSRYKWGFLQDVSVFWYFRRNHTLLRVRFISSRSTDLSELRQPHYLPSGRPLGSTVSGVGARETSCIICKIN